MVVCERVVITMTHVAAEGWLREESVESFRQDAMHIVCLLSFVFVDPHIFTLHQAARVPKHACSCIPQHTSTLQLNVSSCRVEARTGSNRASSAVIRWSRLARESRSHSHSPKERRRCSCSGSCVSCHPVVLSEAGATWCVSGHQSCAFRLLVVIISFNGLHGVVLFSVFFFFFTAARLPFMLVILSLADSHSANAALSADVHFPM